MPNAQALYLRLKTDTTNAGYPTLVKNSNHARYMVKSLVHASRVLETFRPRARFYGCAT